ncbi:MAG: TraR/DksA family transcriptional regulator [Myxococcales bacterium]|nr:TraR/DksA family transcriptional regulator [Myxococcales bacterium]
MLTSIQAAELRTLLEAFRERILASANDASHFSRDRDRTRMGRDSVDESAEEAMYGTKLRLADRDSQTLNAIEVAMGRLAAGTLGECEECEETIGFARLRARPMSKLCIECQEDREAGFEEPGA